jgi:hypothetical protein
MKQAMQPISFVSPIFDVKSSSIYNLSILCEEYGIAICIFDAQKRQFLAIKYILFAGKANTYNDLNKFVGGIIKEEFLLQLKYKTIKCIYPTRCATLTPANWLQPSQYKTALEYMHIMDDLDEIQRCKVKDIGAECIFAAPAPLTAKLFEKMGSIIYYHQCVPLIHAVMQCTEYGSSAAVMAVSMSACFANIALKIAEKFVLYNTFELGAPQDLLYFILLIANKFELDCRQIKFLIIGAVKKMYLDELTREFENILQMKIEEKYCAPQLRTCLDSRFDLLLLLEQCE